MTELFLLIAGLLIILLGYIFSRNQPEGEAWAFVGDYDFYDEFKKSEKMRKGWVPQIEDHLEDTIFIYHPDNRNVNLINKIDQ